MTSLIAPEGWTPATWARYLDDADGGRRRPMNTWTDTPTRGEEPVSTTTTDYIDRRTGEVVPPEVVEQIARDFASAKAEHDAARAEARRIEADVQRYREDLIAIVRSEERLDAGTHWLVMSPPDRPAQRVDRLAADSHREVLLGLGLGKVTEDYHAPTAAEVRKEKDRIIAAGIPLERLLPEPLAGPPEPRLVAK